MSAPRPTEVINRLVGAVRVQVWTIGVVTECGASARCIHYIAQDDDLRSSPGDPGQLRYSGKLQLRRDVTHIGELARLQVVEVVEAETEFIDRRRREDTGVRQHGLMHMCLHVASVTIELRLDLGFAAPTVSAEPIGLRRLREVDSLNELVLVGHA